MGNSCYNCANYSDQAYIMMFGAELQPFQNMKVKMSALDKYDQFYRVVGEPFIRMDISDFITDLDILIEEIETQFETTNPNIRCNLEKIPYVKFLEHFKTKKEWIPHIMSTQSTFMRLLQLENLFFEKKVVD